MLLFSIQTTACDGSDVFWTWILWLLGALVIGLILGWLLKQLFGYSDSNANLDAVKDDLTKIEGIGPKIKELLNNNSIWSFSQLALTHSTKLQKILDDAGPAFTVHNPRTWSAQAKLADEGHWEDLIIWQDHLKGGL